MNFHITELTSLDRSRTYQVGVGGVTDISFDESGLYYMIYEEPFFLRTVKTIEVVPASAFISVFVEDTEN